MKGNIDEGFNEAEEVLEGTVRVGSQEHFYMEPQTCIAIPQEDGGMIVHRYDFLYKLIVGYH